MGCVKRGGKGSSCPRGEFLLMGCVKRGGKGISHPRGEFLPMGCVKRGGKGISHPRGVSSQKKSPNRCGTVGAFFRLSFSVIGVT